ncbi:MAG TPA: SPFH domain-containing protein, partial [Candidatus Baltobacteraceae bacterium]|nr:SPFH domain-containing protein [Candidatus Baltobacteraceae bacterium]
MKKNILTFIVGAVLVVIFALLLFVFQVRQSETAVVTTFGKPDAKPITEPGAYFKWPWPVQKVYKYDQRVQNFEDKFSETITRDNNDLILTVYAGWKISDAMAFYPKFAGSVPNAQNALEGMLRNAKNAVVSTN